MATLTETLDNLYTTTIKATRPGLADNIFGAHPYFWWLKKHGHMVPIPGGRRIEVNLIKAKTGGATWLAKGGVTNLDDTETMTVGHWDWTFLAEDIVRHWQDDAKNRSKYAVINMAKAKMEQVKTNLTDTIETQLAAGAGSSSNAFDGLQHLVSDTAAYGTAVGGHIPSGSGNAWWRNQSTDMTGESFAGYGRKRMLTMLNNVSNNSNQARPDIILSAQDPFEYYNDMIFGYRRFHDGGLVDAGFRSLEFEGVPLVWAPALSDRMYFLNTKHIYIVYNPAFFFEPTGWKEPENQPFTRAMQIGLQLAHVTNRKRVLGVIHSIDTE